MYRSQEQKDESSWQSHFFLVTFKFRLVWSFTLHSILWTLHCRYLYELFVHSTSAMNQASDSRRTRPTPSKSLQTIKQMKIHVPNDAIASLTPSWESSKCPVLKIFIKYPYFPKIYMLPCNPLLENPCFQSGNHVMVRLILKNISKTVSQCIPCIPHALLLPCSKACVDTSRNLQKDQGGTL